MGTSTSWYIRVEMPIAKSGATFFCHPSKWVAAIWAAFFRSHSQFTARSYRRITTLFLICFLSKRGRINGKNELHCHEIACDFGHARWLQFRPNICAARWLRDERIARPQDLVAFETESNKDRHGVQSAQGAPFCRPFGPNAVCCMRNGRYYYYKQLTADHYFLLSETQREKRNHFRGIIAVGRWIFAFSQVNYHLRSRTATAFSFYTRTAIVAAKIENERQTKRMK